MSHHANFTLRSVKSGRSLFLMEWKPLEYTDLRTCEVNSGWVTLFGCEAGFFLTMAFGFNPKYIPVVDIPFQLNLPQKNKYGHVNLKCSAHLGKIDLDTSKLV